MSDSGTTIGIWVGEDDTLLDRVDERLTYGDSRSAYTKEALELRMTVDDALAAGDLSFDSERDKRAFVRQAIVDASRRSDP